MTNVKPGSHKRYGSFCDLFLVECEVLHKQIKKVRSQSSTVRHARQVANHPGFGEITRTPARSSSIPGRHARKAWQLPIPQHRGSFAQ